MGCNCKVTEIILGVIVLIFAFMNAAWATWIVAIAAILLIIHALMCKNCGKCMPDSTTSKPLVKKKK
jgi:protein-S-isoprenylcysteine O-methyltransferase Ste14